MLIFGFMSFRFIYDFYIFLKLVCFFLFFLTFLFWLVLRDEFQKFLLPELIVIVSLILLFSLTGLLFSDNFISYIVFFETTSLCFYFLMLQFLDVELVRVVFRYFLHGLLVSGFYLFGVLLFYFVFGSLDFQVLSMLSVFASNNDQYINVLMLALVLVLSSLFFKLGVWPNYRWIVDVYAALPSLVFILIVGVSKFVYFVCIVKFLFFFFPIFVKMKWIFFMISMIFLVLGVFHSLFRNSLRKIFGYSTIGTMALSVLVLLDQSFLSVFSALIYVYFLFYFKYIFLFFFNVFRYK
jgi:NADH:ubiquinone oxidoreductase subunit 2 (subunit N)